MDRADLPLVAVVGPTGSGKSDLGIAIARQFEGEIVNCDSLQVYRYFDVGTAKVPEAERCGIPHHMIDVADPDEDFTAGQYAAWTRPLLAEIVGRGRVPVVVGGTGFYLTALIDGLFPGPGRDDELRQRLAVREARRPGSLHLILRRFDPISARKIHPNDVKKVIRALEVSILSGQPISAVFAAGRDALRGFRALKIGLNPPRAELYDRLNRRCAAMFESGLADEVRGILARGYSAKAKPFESHGYKQVIDLMNDRLSYEEALTQACQNTRRYAKRQWTWFHHDKEVLWYNGFGDHPELKRTVLRAVGTFLADFSRIS